MDWYIYPAVIAAGFGCGFINTLAGSGSLISLPVLIFLGLPANMANGTNRVGILIQTVVSLRSFKKQNMLDFRGGIMLALPAIVGAIIGAQIAVNLDEQMLRRVIGALMVVMLVFILARPKRWLKGQLEVLGRRPRALELVIFFFIGAYGGFIQAGVGIFLLAGLVLGVGYDLVRANAVKVLIVLCFTAFAMVVFMINGQILWGLGLLLAVGNAGGGWLAAKLAIERGAGLVRWFLIAVVIVSAVKLLGLLDLLINAF
ncbi:MAG: sulfite exporter TauE/SafE family protein [Deltaproteobacteria bacterium]|nr:sulfite exporter TauE/SafE family protein [Deltaproteobacteria bacterium]